MPPVPEDHPLAWLFQHPDELPTDHGAVFWRTLCSALAVVAFVLSLSILLGVQ